MAITSYTRGVVGIGHAARASHSMTTARPGGRVPPELLRPWVLLLLGESANHGYALFGTLRKVGIDISGVSVVYGALRRLERAGLVSSALDYSSTGPARRVYQLTADGRSVRDDWAAGIEGLRRWLASKSSACPN